MTQRAPDRELLFVDRLRGLGFETPRLDSELLLAHAIGVERTAVVAHGDAPVGVGVRGQDFPSATCACSAPPTGAVTSLPTPVPCP